MNEAKFNTILAKYLRAYPPAKTFLYEAKICKGTSLPFNSLQEHQKQALLNAKHGKVHHKIADAGYTNPCDGFFISNAEGYVCVMFYKPRQLKEFYIIDIDRWCEKEKKSDRKSLTRDMAEEISLVGRIEI